jgi:hypothetical protein
MTRHVLITSAIAWVTLFSYAALAQENSAPSQLANLDPAGLPPEHGIYYHSATDWVPLESTILMPFRASKGATLEVLNVGSEKTVAQMPGPHAGVQIAKDARPIFFLHGILPDLVYLVRTASKADYRKLRMPESKPFNEWTHFRAKDLMEFDVVYVNGDVVVIRPRMELGPGEYTLASSVQSGDRWLRLGYSFGLLTGRAGK